MAFYQTKNPNLGKFSRVLQWKMLVYFMAIWCTYFKAIWDIFTAIWYIVGMVIWYIFPVLVCCATKNLATLSPGTPRAV
jgi:hypothetical protein